MQASRRQSFKISHVRHLQRAQAVCLVRETPYLLKNLALCLETDRGQSLVTGDCPNRVSQLPALGLGRPTSIIASCRRVPRLLHPSPCSDRSNADGYRGRGRGDPPVCRAAAPCRPPARAQRAGLDTDAEAVVAFDIHDRKRRCETRPAMRTRSNRLSQGFCRYDASRDGDRDRVRQVDAAQFMARRIQIGLYAGE